MKAETVVLVIVISATSLSAMILSLITSLSQWANSNTSPPKLMWIVIIGGAIVQGLNQLVAYLSKRFADWVNGRILSTPSGDTQRFTNPNPSSKV